MGNPITDVLKPIHQGALDTMLPGAGPLLKKIDPVGPLLGGGGSGGGIASAPGVQPAPPESSRTAPDLTTFERPTEALSIPTFLGLSSSMTPTQQLSRIATLGTQGSFGDIRSPREGPYAGKGASDVAKEYFKNLALRSFTNQSGSPMNENSLLPVYEQYLSQALGQPPIEGRQALPHFLTRLTRI